MKNSSEKRRFRIVLIMMVLALVIGLAVGSMLLFIMPTLSGRQIAEEKVTELGRRFSSNGMRNYDTGAVRTLIVDKEGRETDFFVSAEEAYFNQNAWPDSWYLKIANKYLPETLAGKSFSKIHVVTNDIGELFVYTVSGASLYNSGLIIGAVYMFKRNTTVATTILIFMILFIIIWAIGLALYVSYRFRQKRRAEIDTVKHNYVANVAHSLKTPITVTKALSEALNDDIIEDPEKRKMYCRQIYEESERLEHLVIDIMKLSEIQSDARNFTKEEILMEELLEPILDRYEDLCICKGIAFEVDASFYKVPPLMTNISCIREVTEIILDNALKFAAKGCISVFSSHKGKTVIVEIRDNGPGISKADLPLIFERFYKGKDVVNPEGNGLGLAIAKESMTSMGEKIWAESDGEGCGASFFFTIHTA